MSQGAKCPNTPNLYTTPVALCESFSQTNTYLSTKNLEPVGFFWLWFTASKSEQPLLKGMELHKKEAQKD